MTYGLAFASRAFAGVVTDRRLTGARRTEDVDKCGLVVYTDGRLAYTLTGLAEQGAFRTRIWLAEKLCEAGRGRRSVDAALKEFAAIATADVGKMRFRKPTDGRLTVALAGYALGPFGDVIAVLRLVSNFERFGHEPSEIPWREFEESRADFNLSNESPIGIVPIGSAFPSRRTLEPMADALARAVPPTVAIDAAVEIIRAESTPTGPIGTWCSSVVLPRAGNQSALLDYHPGEPRQQHRLPTFVYAKYDDAGAFILAESGMEGVVGAGRTALRVPNVERHLLCPCRSGRPFKDCHGGKRAAQKIAQMHGRFNVMFKELPSEDTELFKIASAGIVLGPGDSAAIATLSGRPSFRISQRSSVAALTRQSPSTSTGFGATPTGT